MKIDLIPVIVDHNNNSPHIREDVDYLIVKEAIGGGYCFDVAYASKVWYGWCLHGNTMLYQLDYDDIVAIFEIHLKVDLDTALGLPRSNSASNRSKT